MTRLSDYADSRDNNFNLIRMTAALAVLVDHCLPLATGVGTAGIFLAVPTMGLGAVAVDVFFVTSGFLVTASLLRRQHTLHFLLARILRIYPALLAMQLLVVLGMGLFFTTLPKASYLFNHETLLYWITGSSLIAGTLDTLPGVFEDNPLHNGINGSLWTLPYEVRMYAILAVTWGTLSWWAKERRTCFTRAVIGAAALAASALWMCHLYAPEAFRYTRLFVMFFFGAAACLMQDRIVVSRPLFWSLFLLLPALAVLDRNLFVAGYFSTLPYLLLYLAYVPAGPIRAYNQVGDYSYGTYIYAWPVQQATLALVPGISALGLALVAIAITFPLAAASWHLIEQRALRIKTQSPHQEGATDLMLSRVANRDTGLAMPPDAVEGGRDEALLVRHVDGRITAWSEEAERLYGWNSSETIGRTSHHLLETAFPCALASIEAELSRSGRWEGDLMHKRRDGSRLVVHSRWQVRRETGRAQPIVFEWNRKMTS